MGKGEKRKTRLNKGGGGEFIGFGAFSTVSTAVVAPLSTGSSNNSVASSIQASAPSLSLSPVYAGKDPTLALLFQRIGQKRDFTTKTKALQELTEYFQNAGNQDKSSTSESNSGATKPTKKTLVEALCHLLYLYHIKLYYDTNSSVRVAALACLQQVHSLVPKAWKTLTSEQQPELLGMMFCSQADPSAQEVRAAAGTLCKSLLAIAPAEAATPENQEQLLAFNKGVWLYVQRIVSYGRPMALHDALFVRHKGSKSNNSPASKEDGKKGKSAQSSAKSSLSEEQVDQIEERYERIVGGAIEGLQLWIHLYLPIIVNNNNRIDDEDTISYEEIIRMVWKNMNSPRSQLRRKTYTFVATCCQQHQKQKKSEDPPYVTLVNTQKVGTILAQCLSSDKEPTNQSTLLETVLAFLAFLPKTSRYEAFLTSFSKPIHKLLKRFCHGASASQWAPTLLPIIAMIGSSGEGGAATTELQLSLLTSASEGNSNVTADMLEVSAAVAESAAFVLLRQASTSSPTSTDGEPADLDRDASDTKSLTLDIVTSIAQRWLDALSVYLRTVPSGAAQRVHQRLGKGLARDLIQLDQASFVETSVMHHIRDWFWGRDGIYVSLLVNFGGKKTVDKSQDKNLACWLNEINGRFKEQYGKRQISVEGQNKHAQGTAGSQGSNLSNVLRDKFHSQLQTFQGASGFVPKEDTYDLWIAILGLVGVDQVFAHDSAKLAGPERETEVDLTSADKFVMNDVLRWMIIHTSSLSDHSELRLTKLDFTLYSLCEGTKTTGVQWGSIIRELVAAKCDLGLLRAGLLIMLQNGENIEDLRCNELDNLASQIAKESVPSLAIRHQHDDDSDEVAAFAEEDRKVADFLGLCVGFDTEGPDMLVGEDVISTFVDCACLEMGSPRSTEFGHVVRVNPVLETLVCLIRTRKESLSEDQIHRVLLESWRQGGDLWRDTSRSIIDEDVSIRSKIIQLASKEAQALFDDASHLGTESKDSEDSIQAWSRKAFRLLELCGLSSGQVDRQEGVPRPSLTIVGLGDIQRWKNWQSEKKGHHLANLCLLELVTLIDNAEARIQVLENSEGVETSELIVAILMSLSGGSDDVLHSESARRRNDACARLLSSVGAKNIGNARTESWCHKLVEELEACLVDGDPMGRLDSGIAVLSQLIQLMFARIVPADLRRDDEVVPRELNEGDEVFYIPDKEDSSVREQAKIVKVHRDMPSELYFTIKLSERGDQEPERQTVAERLRHQAFSPNQNLGIVEDSVDTQFVSGRDISSEEQARRQGIVNLVMQKIVMRFSTTWSGLTAEILNIVISQCGVSKDRGIGSLHYEVFSILTAIQSHLKGLLDCEERNGDEIVSDLWKLSLALGFGCNTPASKWSLQLLHFDPADSISSILTYYNEFGSGSGTEFDAAASAWLATSVSSLEDNELRNQALSLMFRLSARLLGPDDRDKDQCFFRSNDFLALRAIHVAQEASSHIESGGSVVQEDEAVALAALVKAFASRWEGQESGNDPIWTTSPYFGSVVHSSFLNRPGLIGASCRQCANDLVRSIPCGLKRWYCLRFLFAYADAGIPLHDDPESSMNGITADYIRIWSRGLTSEEAEELEDDVCVAAQWLPDQLMNGIESWEHADQESENVDDDKSVGRMVTWLALLRIVDEASTKDSFNRPALTSYANKCGAVDTILNTALSYANIGNDRKVKAGPVIDSEELWNHGDALELSEIARLVMSRTVEVFPALSKHWWEMRCPKYFAQPVSDFVEMRVAPEILRRELERIKQTSSFGDMQVTGSNVSRECVARYVQDDFTLTVVIRLPPSFPFRSAEVDCSKTLGVPEKRWKRWSLQITLMLNNESGKVGDALMLWKENVDKEFEGVEPCPVCYSVLHVKTHKLPELECKTCHNRFHFDCLTQWFRSSGKNACVLCQQPWSGTRV